MQTSDSSQDLAYAKSLANDYWIGQGLEFSWDNKAPGANLVMWEVTKDNKFKQLLDGWKNDIKSRSKTPNGMLHLTQWGSVRHALNVAFVRALIGEDDDLAFVQSQIEYVLGHNGKGPRIDGKPGSYVTGYGDVYPSTPHHASSYCPPYPQACTWDNFGGKQPNHWLLHGALIGGPKWATDDFTNDRYDYVTNEVSLDYNCGFTGVLAFMSQNGSPSTTAKPTTADPTTNGPTSKPSTTQPATTEEPGSCSLGKDLKNIGELTVYAAAPDGGNCGLDWTKLQGTKTYTNFVALPKELRYDHHMHCGQCIKLRCSCEQQTFNGQNGMLKACEGGKDTIVMVTDSCPTCHIAGDLDLSYNAWDEVTGEDEHSRYDGSYEFVPCPDEFLWSGGPQMRFKDGSTEWWTVVQPMNHKHQIEEVVYKENGGNWKQAKFPKVKLWSYYGERVQISPRNMKVNLMGPSPLREPTNVTFMF